jgi:hypothetical protein
MISKVVSLVNTKITVLRNLLQCKLVQLYQRIREFRCLQRHSRDLLERALSRCTYLHPKGQHSTSYETYLSLASLLFINIKFEKSVRKTASILTHSTQVTSPNSQGLSPFSAIYETIITFRNLPSSVLRPRMPIASETSCMFFKIAENGEIPYEICDITHLTHWNFSLT